MGKSNPGFPTAKQMLYSHCTNELNILFTSIIENKPKEECLTLEIA